MEHEEEYYTQPSFGQIVFSRVTGTADFYGSELTQDHYIEMTLMHSSVKRDLSQDWYHADGGLPLARVRMSSGQFSEMITSMNHGDGVCCTIEFIDGKRTPPLVKQESRKEFVHRKFEDRMAEFAKRLREKQNQAREIVKKKTLSKEDIKNLTFHLDWLTQEIAGNIPFFAKCFQETMDDVVLEAKLEVENAIQHKINILGLTELHKQNNLLSSENEKV